MTQQKSPDDIRSDPFVHGLLKRMPDEIAAGFSNEQLIGLKMALGTRQWRVHPLDWRGTMRIWRWQYYYVIVAGRERRQLTRAQLRSARRVRLLMLGTFFTFCTLLGLLIIYLIKSALGIDIFPNYSFGIWGWFKQHILSHF